MKLSKWAKLQGICYKTAWILFHQNKIPGAYTLQSGAIIVPDPSPISSKQEHNIVYARVSSSENKPNLDSQALRVSEFCNAKGWIVHEIIKECASGLNDNRPKLQKIFKDKKATRIIVEHKDRLTRFGFEYIKTLFDGEIIVINEVVEEKQDLMNDFVSLVTSFCARLYGLRRSTRKTKEIIEKVTREENGQREE